MTKMPEVGNIRLKLSIAVDRIIKSSSKPRGGIQKTCYSLSFRSKMKYRINFIKLQNLMLLTICIELNVKT